MENIVCQVECEFSGERTLKELLIELLVFEFHMSGDGVNEI